MTPSESRIQQDCVKWYRNTFCLKHHLPRGLIMSIPNEGKSETEQLAKLQTGLLPGASDLIVILPSGHLLWVEVKDHKGRQSDKQKEFQSRVKKLGFKYYLIRSLDEFKKIITESFF